jgi:hypothetical protein
MDRDNTFLPLCHQDIKKGKETKQSRHQQTTHHPRSPHHPWRPPRLHRHYRSRQEDERVLYQKRPTQQESARHRGHQHVGRRGHPGTQEGARPTMENLLVAVHNLHLLLHHIHALICAMAHGEDTS